MRRLIFLFVAALLALPGCDDRSYREIGAAINVLTKKSDELPGPAIARLKQIGRRAVGRARTAAGGRLACPARCGRHTLPCGPKRDLIVIRCRGGPHP